MVAAPLAPDTARRPLTWSASAAFGALWIIAYIAAGRLVELASGRPASLASPGTALTIGVGIPVATLLFRYVSVWTIRGESARSSSVWIATLVSILPHLWPFEGVRSVAHALAAAAVTFTVFFAASRRYR